MISVELKVIGGKHAGQSIPLDRKKFLIGREQDCQLRPNSELVSRHHCVFTVDEFSVRLRDLGSTNGTSVNGETIRKEVVLQQGDHVTVGSLDFNIHINEVAADSSADQLDAATIETTVAGTETLTEMTPVQPGETLVPGATTGEIPAITAPLQSEPSAPTEPAAQTESAPAPPAAPTAPIDVPTTSAGDTTVIAQPAILPGQTPYQPMMPQPMGYPMYGNQPYPGMPGQQFPPQQYPGQPYPGQPYPGQPYPGQQYPPQQVPLVAAPPETAAQSAEPEAPIADVNLPDPSSTGAKEAPPKPPKAENSGEQDEKPEQSNESADAIIKQYMQKRPGG